MYRTLLRITVLLLLISVKSYSQCNTTVNLMQNNPQASSYGAPLTTGYESYRAYDMGADSLSTKWSVPYQDGREWGVDFGVKFNFCTIRMVWGDNEYPTGIVVKGSNNFTDWTVLDTLYGNHNKIVTMNLANVDSFRIIDIYVFGIVSGGTNYGLYNMQLYARGTNQKPVVSVNANTSYIVGTDINITANASDADGSITKVAFYQGTTKLGVDSTSPYACTWTGAAQGGPYAITARAFDNAGDSTVSTAVNVTVTAAAAYMKNWTLNGNNINNSNTGTVFIGTVPASSRGDTAMKLSVNGNVYAKKLTVTVLNWSDYVFGSAYKLKPLPDVEKYITSNKHLPGIPSEKEVLKEGISVGEHQSLLLGKIEELTLYVIQLNKKIESQQRQINQLRHKKQK